MLRRSLAKLAAGSSDFPLPRRASFEQGTRAVSLLLILLGGSVLVGWTFGLPLLRSFGALGTMKVNAAIGFVLAGWGLRDVLLWQRRGYGVARVRLLALAVFALGMGTCLEYVLGVDLKFDQLLFEAPSEPGRRFPGRMSATAAATFVLSSLALLGLTSTARYRRSAHHLALVVLFVAFVALAGYAFDIPVFYGADTSWARMAPHTALGVLLLSLGLLGAERDGVLPALLLQDTMASDMARRVLPALLVIPLLLGWLLSQGEAAGLYQRNVGFGVVVTATTLSIAVAISWLARTHSAAEQALKASMQDERFLFQVGEILRRANDADVVLPAVSKSLVEYVGCTLCYFGDIHVEKDLGVLHGVYNAGHAQLPKTFRLSDFSPQIKEEVLNGFTNVVADTVTDERTKAQAATYLSVGLRSRVMIPLLKEGRWIGKMTVATDVPRVWTDREIGLFQVVAERSWLWLEHLRALQAVKRSEERFALAVDGANDGIWDWNVDTGEAFFSPRWCTLLGFKQSELAPHITTWESLIHPDDLGLAQRALEQHFTEREPFDVELRMRTSAGTHQWFRTRGQAVWSSDGVPSRVAGAISDISAQKLMEGQREQLVVMLKSLNAGLEERVEARTAELRALLQERDLLLKEVHHRVKNNLQVIASLINLQIRKLRDASTRSALEECKARIQSIALIHEKLYQSRDYTSIPFSDYVRSLIDTIFRTNRASGAGAPRLDLHIEPITLPVDRAIPCGLLLNELVTNALKHAFPDSRGGTVHVTLSRDGEERVLLCVRDDGVGLPSGFLPNTAKSMGMQLILTLVDQLGGVLDTKHEGGTTFRVSFPLVRKPFEPASAAPASAAV